MLAASTAGGVRLYSMRTRSWSDPLPAPAGERAVDIAERKGTWIARSEANRLVQLGARPSVLIGGGEQMPRRQPTDVLQAGSDIYLSWPGTIQRYDVRSRQVAASWTFDAAEPARLAGVVGSEPLSVAGGVARVGVREIARGVHGMFTSGPNLWLTREDRGRRYLEARPLASLAPQACARRASTPSCLFRTPSAGVDAGVLHDARRLSNGLVAVTTDAGLKLHSRDRHSWYGVAGLLPNTGRGTLATIGSALIVWDLSAGALAKADGSDSRETLQIVRSPVTLPDSCSTAPARVDRAPDASRHALSRSTSAPGQAYVVRDDGSVDRVDETATRPMIVRESQGPPETDVVRTWHFPDVAASVLWVATRRSLWQYDLEHHSWFEIALEYPALRLRSGPATTRRTEEASIDLDSGSGEIAVFVTAGLRGISRNGRERAGPPIEDRAGPIERAEAGRRSSRAVAGVPRSAPSRSFGTCRTACSRSCRRRTAVPRPRTRIARSHGIADDGGLRSGARARCS